MSKENNNDKEITTSLGEFRLYENGNFSIHSTDTEKALYQARFAKLFEENGYKGLMKDGKVICPPFFEEIAFLTNPERLYLLRNGWYARFAKESTCYMEHRYNKDNRFIFRDGKMGWMKNGKIVVDPIYDDVERWGCFNIYETRNKNDVKYFTEDGKEVLTFRREVKDENNFISPFWLRCDEGDVICVIECPPSENLPESNILTFNDDLVTGLDRFDRNTIIKELINKNDELPLTNKKLEGLTNEFSYEFSAYRLKVKDEKPVEKLLELFNRLYINDNSWFYVIRLTTSPGEKIPADELLKLSDFLDKNKRDTLGRVIGIGVDESLNPGEVSALIITHYNECCFPPYERFDWIDTCKKGTLEEVKAKDNELQNFTRTDIVEESQADFLQDSYDTIFTNIVFNPYKERSWEETEKVLDYIATKSDRYKSKVWKTVKEIAKPEVWTDRELLMNYLGWLLKKGGNVNQVKAEMTPLDYVLKTMKEDERKADSAMFELRDLLIRYGALPYEKYKRAYLQDQSEYEFALMVLSNE